MTDINQPRQTRFIDTICHEIRNPLNGMYGAIDILQTSVSEIQRRLKLHKTDNDYLANELITANEALQSLEQCAKQQKNIVDSVLDLAKLEANKVELNLTVFNPKSVINTALQIFQAELMRKQLHVELDLPQDDIWVKGDSYRLTQILTNLLSNAIKFTPKGSITITLKSLCMTEAKLELQFAIIDTGIGMTVSETEKIFDRFSQANAHIVSTYGGTGLGLSICKGLIAMMGGRLQVSSQVNVGTTFHFKIYCSAPAVEETPKAKKHQKRSIREIATLNKDRQQHILIVEDNATNQKILIHYLKQRGYTYQVANNGHEAITLTNHCYFDAILMDIDMPLMNGLAATQQIRANEQLGGERPVPIIGLSGNSNPTDRQEALAAGMNDYLIKPYSKDQIYERLDIFICNSQDLI